VQWIETSFTFGRRRRGLVGVAQEMEHWLLVDPPARAILGEIRQFADLANAFTAPSNDR